MQHSPLSVAILFSGRGGNLHSLAAAIEQQQLNIRIRCAISNRPQAAGLRHAMHYALPTHIIDHREYQHKNAFEHALSKAIDAEPIDLIIMAGFMRVLSAEFVQRYSGKIINLHPSLLPKYRGLDTHQRALTAGDNEHGASVHLVEPELDNGPVIAQYRLPIEHNDTAQSLAERLAPHEHRLLQVVTALFAARVIQVDYNQITLNGQRLKQPLLLDRDLVWPPTSSGNIITGTIE